MGAGDTAKTCGVPRTRIERIVAEDIGITADTALRLERLFGASAQFWLNLQSRFEIETVRIGITAELEKIEKVAA